MWGLQLPCFPNMIRIPLGWKSAFWDRWKGTSRLGWKINWNPPISGKLSIMVSCRFSMIFSYASPLRTVYREVHIVFTFKRCSSCSRPTNFWTVASWKLLVASQICQNLLTVVILCADLQIVQFPVPTACNRRQMPVKNHLLDGFQRDHDDDHNPGSIQTQFSHIFSIGGVPIVTVIHHSSLWVHSVVSPRPH